MEFINGVILIKEAETFTVIGLCVVCAIVVAAIVMLCGGERLYINGKHYFSEWRKTVGVILMGMAFAVLIFLGFTLRSGIPKKLGFTEIGGYEVTLTGEVDMDEFQERYEIIDYENGVYTIKVKEQ